MIFFVHNRPTLTTTTIITNARIPSLEITLKALDVIFYFTASRCGFVPDDLTLCFGWSQPNVVELHKWSQWLN